MFSKFKFEKIELDKIKLDYRNPRIVSQKALISQDEVLQYLFENDDLAEFTKKIALEGKNAGAERPYIVADKEGYTVIEGNTRIAAYKLLTGLVHAPNEYAGGVPKISDEFKSSLLQIDCSIAPNRDALLSIMANAHFGLGDKSKWGYLGSRKAVHDEWKDGKTIASLARAFDLPQGRIKELILEYLLYLDALKLKWTTSEKKILLNPSVEFNPPVRFLQTRGHKQKVGIVYDKANLKVLFDDSEAKKKFRHLISKLVINPQPGVGATATYDQVYSDYTMKSTGKTSKSAANESGTKRENKSARNAQASQKKPKALFGYDAKVNNKLISKLMAEAKIINCERLPAAGTFLLRNIIEALLKHIIDDQKASQNGKSLDLEGAINCCVSKAVNLGNADKKVLSEFKKSHLSYLNLGAHGNVIPNFTRLEAARDCIDQFVKKHV